MKPGFFQGKKFPFTPKRRKKSLGSQCTNIIDTRYDLAAFRSKLANVSWLRSYIDVVKLHRGQVEGLAVFPTNRQLLLLLGPLLDPPAPVPRCAEKNAIKRGEAWGTKSRGNVECACDGQNSNAPSDFSHCLQLLGYSGVVIL